MLLNITNVRNSNSFFLSSNEYNLQTRQPKKYFSFGMLPNVSQADARMEEPSVKTT